MPMPNTEALGEHYAKNGHPAWVLASHLPKAHGVPMSEMGTVWTDEWDDEGETWGVANNGTGADRLWHGPLYTLPTDRTVAIEHPAGAHVVAIDGQGTVPSCSVTKRRRLSGKRQPSAHSGNELLRSTRHSVTLTTGSRSVMPDV